MYWDRSVKRAWRDGQEDGEAKLKLLLIRLSVSLFDVYYLLENTTMAL